MHVSARLDHKLLAIESEHRVHLMLELAAPEAPGAKERPAVDLALVLDRSGSMAGEKLSVARACAQWLVGRLGPRDRVALVDFDDTVRLLAPLGPAGRPELVRALDALTPGGSTNLSGGWLKGAEELRRDGATGSVLLLTDGHANVGVVERESLTGIARGLVGQGVRTTTIGLGGGFDEESLTAIADAGGGDAHYADTPDAAPGIFGRVCDGLTSVVAQNVSVEIRPHGAVSLVRVLNEYPSVAVPGGVQVQLGDAYGGDVRRVVMELEVPYLAALGVVGVADLVVRWVEVGERVAERTLTLPVVVNAVSAEEAAAAGPDGGVVEEVRILAAARARDEAIRRADAGDYAAAALSLDAAAAALCDLAAPSPESVRQLHELDAARELLAEGAYDASMRKRLHYERHRAQRRRG